MGGISVPERSSLDRLKALDSLPNLESQLQEARTLCNHSARAEMILRWLLGKLKSSDEARKDEGCWVLLANCVRILASSRIAFLLGSNGFIDILQTTSSEKEIPQTTLLAVVSCLNVLLELSGKESGAAVKSLLSISSPVAATVCGNLLRHVHECSLALDEQLWQQSLLDPALSIWSLRQRSDSDDENFNAHCLMPSLSLLRWVQSMASTSSNKRKRGQNDSRSAQATESTLQRVIAKHTVIPARTVFFKGREVHTRQSRGHRPEKEQQPGIKERLGPLKMAILRQSDSDVVHSIPVLLDIALRSVATPTPKHRLNERPWIEALLEALRSCISGQVRLIKNRILSSMLGLIYCRGHMLTLQTLTGIVKDDASPDESGHIDSDLIVQVIKLDASVFCDTSLMETLFNNLTVQLPVFEDTQALLRDSILVPVMRIHAKSRTLSTFVDYWSRQLTLPENQSASSIWSELAASFSEMCEDAMSVEQTLHLFDTLSATINDMADPLQPSQEPEAFHKLHASLTILRGLLFGVHRDTTIARLHSRLEILQLSLQALAGNKSTKTMITLHYQLWTLLTRVFELWFPSWAITQGSRDDVAENGLSNSLRGAFTAALTQYAAQETMSKESIVVLSAQAFVATVCVSLGRYSEIEQCRSLYAEAVERLSQTPNVALPTFIKFPDLFARLNSDVRQDLVSELLSSVGGTKSGDGNSEDLPGLSLQALVSTASNLPRRDALDDIIRATLDRLKQQRAVRDSPHLEDAAVSVLSTIDMAILGQGQRVEILDTVMRLDPPQATSSGPFQLQQRLALMVSVLRHPCRGARLLTDAEGIWDVVGLFKSKDAKKKGAEMPLDTLENLEIFDELSKCLIGFLMANQQQKATREILAKFSDQTKQRIEQLRGGRDAAPGTRTASLVLFKNVFGAMSKLNEDPGAFALYLNALAAESKPVIAEVASDPSSIWAGGCRSAPILWLFDALVAIPDGTRPSPLGMELAETVKTLAYTVLDLDDTNGAQTPSGDRSKIKVASFQVACKYAPTAGRRLMPIAEKLLQQDLTAREYMTVLSTFEGVFEADDDEWTVALQQLMLQERPQSPAALILQQKAIKTLSDEDLESSATGVGHLRGTESFTAYQIFDHTLNEVSQNANLQAKKIALQTLVIIFKEKPFMVNQYGIEQTLTTLHNLLETYKHASALYTDISAVFATLFAAHRSRLQGRFHLLVPLFQNLLTHLFTPTLPSPITHAHQLARLLETFSNPQIRPRKTSDLVDASRKAQARAGQYAPYILHHYCSQILTGSAALREGVREALMPGLWVTIEAMESYNPEGVKVLSAAMNNSERAVLRSLYEDWKRFGKWEGL